MSGERIVTIRVTDERVRQLDVFLIAYDGAELDMMSVPVPPDDRLARALDLATRDVMTYWDDDAAIKERPGTTPKDIIEAARFIRAHFHLDES